MVPGSLAPEPALADDLIQPFHVPALDLHGRLVRLGPAVDAILTAHDYPRPVSMLLGEALALTAALAGALKFEGTFTTQVQGDGPLRLLVADYRTDGAMRGYAGFDEDAIAGIDADSATGDARASYATGDARLFGAGHMAFTVDRGHARDRYQGLVAIEGATLASNVRAYLSRSVQMRADIQVAALPRADNAGAWRAGALLVEQLPGPDGPIADDDHAERWRRGRALARRLVRADLADPLALPAAVIGPLFRAHDVRLHAPRPLRFECRCSPERADTVLQWIPPGERAELVEDGRIEVTCDYCNRRYIFAPDGARLADA